MQVVPHTYQPAVAGASAHAAASASSGSGTITSSDFLALLVTEMKNQDPTANTDPNAYIDQLVQVNSLQQLIQVNQTLTGMSGALPAADGSVTAAPSSAGRLATALAPGQEQIRSTVAGLPKT